MLVGLVSMFRGALLEFQNYITILTGLIPAEVLDALQLGETVSFFGFSCPVFILYLWLFNE